MPGYNRNGLRQILQELIDLAKELEKRSEVAHYAHMHNCISDTLGNGKNFWKELRRLGLIPKASDAFYNFMHEELNDHFTNIAISSTENLLESLNSVSSALLRGFCLSQVSENGQRGRRHT